MSKILCLLGFHRLEMRGRLIQACVKQDCNAAKILNVSMPYGVEYQYWRWDWSIFKAFR